MLVKLLLHINIEISYASKKAIEKVEKNGGKVNLNKRFNLSYGYSC